VLPQHVLSAVATPQSAAIDVPMVLVKHASASGDPATAAKVDAHVMTRSSHGVLLAPKQAMASV